jgi:hypothetical protein
MSVHRVFNRKRRHDMAKKKAAKKKGKKALRKTAPTKKARKALRRPSGSARRSGETGGSGKAPARAATKRKTAPRKGPARKAVRSGRTTARKTRKKDVIGRPRRPEREAQAANQSIAAAGPEEALIERPE